MELICDNLHIFSYLDLHPKQNHFPSQLEMRILVIKTPRNHSHFVPWYYYNTTDALLDVYLAKYIPKLTFLWWKQKVSVSMVQLPVYKEKCVNPIATRKNTRYSCFPMWNTLYRTSTSYIARLASKQQTCSTLTWYVRWHPTGRQTACTASHVLHLKLSNAIWVWTSENVPLNPVCVCVGGGAMNGSQSWH